MLAHGSSLHSPLSQDSCEASGDHAHMRHTAYRTVCLLHRMSTGVSAIILILTLHYYGATLMISKDGCQVERW